MRLVDCAFYHRAQWNFAPQKRGGNGRGHWSISQDKIWKVSSVYDISSVVPITTKRQSAPSWGAFSFGAGRIGTTEGGSQNAKAFWTPKRSGGAPQGRESARADSSQFHPSSFLTSTARRLRLKKCIGRFKAWVAKKSGGHFGDI